jgi:hypothetical protein
MILILILILITFHYITLHYITFQCGEKLPENGERNKQKIEPNQEKSKVLDCFEINSICSSLGESEL